VETDFERLPMRHFGSLNIQPILKARIAHFSANGFAFFVLKSSWFEAN
jgi:hypothetical protein